MPDLLLISTLRQPPRHRSGATPPLKGGEPERKSPVATALGTDPLAILENPSPLAILENYLSGLF